MAFPPETDQRRRATLGGDFYPKGTRQGTIVAYDQGSDSYTVAVEGEPGNPNEIRGRVFPNIPRSKSSSGMETVLPADVPVIVNFDLRNQPYIAGIINTNTSRSMNAKGTGTTIDAGGGFSNPSTEVVAGAYYRSPNVPKDMLPGDHFICTPDGNYVSVQAGQLNRIFGAERAQIIVSGYHSAVRVVCENYEHLSAIGETKIETVAGRASFSFRGRVDQKSERDDGEGSVAFDIGDKGKLVSLQIKSPSGQMLSMQQFSPTGKITLLSLEDIDTVCSKIRRETVGVSRAVKIYGNDLQYVKSTKAESIGGSWKVQVGSSGVLTYGQDLAQMIGNNQLTSVGGNISRTVTGGFVDAALPTNRAIDEKVLNGSHVCYMGFPLHTASPAAMAGYRLYVHTGAIVFGEEVPLLDAVPPKIPNPSAMAVVALNTTQLGSIGLGGIPPAASALLAGTLPTATNPVVKYNELFALLTSLISMLDTHVHPTAWGPSGPAIAGPANGGLFNTALGGQLVPIASVRVMLGA